LDVIGQTGGISELENLVGGGLASELMKRINDAQPSSLYRTVQPGIFLQAWLLIIQKMMVPPIRLGCFARCQ
jgi:hypothetical protein